MVRDVDELLIDFSLPSGATEPAFESAAPPPIPRLPRYKRLSRSFRRWLPKRHHTWEVGEIVRPIHISLETERGSSKPVEALATIETGRLYNVVSRRIANKLEWTYDPTDSGEEIISLTGPPLRSIGTLKARWVIGRFETRPLIPRGHKLLEAEFKVSAQRKDQFDVIIGMETIRECGLLWLGNPL